MFIVDKIDISKEIMICEDLDKNLYVKLPILENAKEGSYIKIVDSKYVIDDELTVKKRNEIRSKLEYLKLKSK